MFERLLEPGSQDVPDCTCGHAMRYVKIETKSDDAAVKHFSCVHYERELFLMVWAEVPVPVARVAQVDR